MRCGSDTQDPRTLQMPFALRLQTPLSFGDALLMSLKSTRMERRVEFREGEDDGFGHFTWDARSWIDDPDFGREPSVAADTQYRCVAGWISEDC